MDKSVKEDLIASVFFISALYITTPLFILLGREKTALLSLSLLPRKEA